MRRAPLTTSLAVALSAALTLPVVLLSPQAHAAEPPQGSERSAIVVTAGPVAPAPSQTPPAPSQTPPTPDAPPAPVVQTTVVTTSPGPMPFDPQLAELRHRRNSGIGMTISGFTLFGTSYLISALVGTISLDLAADEGGSGTYGRRMLIPVVGPFMAASRTGSATGSLFTAVIGVVQLGGLALGTAGAIRVGRANRQLRLSASSGGLQLQF